VEERISETVRAIAVAKVAVAKNDARIQEMARMVVFK